VFVDGVFRAHGIDAAPVKVKLLEVVIVRQSTAVDTDCVAVVQDIDVRCSQQNTTYTNTRRLYAYVDGAYRVCNKTKTTMKHSFKCVLTARVTHAKRGDHLR